MLDFVILSLWRETRVCRTLTFALCNVLWVWTVAWCFENNNGISWRTSNSYLGFVHSNILSILIKAVLVDICWFWLPWIYFLFFLLKVSQFGLLFHLQGWPLTQPRPINIDYFSDHSAWLRDGAQSPRQAKTLILGILGRIVIERSHPSTKAAALTITQKREPTSKKPTHRKWN